MGRRSLELLGPEEEFPGLAETRQRIPEITAAYRGFTTAVLEERLLVRPHSQALMNHRQHVIASESALDSECPAEHDNRVTMSLC